MRFPTVLAAVSLICLAATPALAAGVNAAAKLSPTGTTNAVATKAHHGASTTYLLVGLGVAGAIGAAVALGHNDSKPASN